MAQNRVLGNSSLEGGFKHIHIVDSFPAVGTLSEEVLINIGYDKRVWVDPTWSGEDMLEERACPSRWQCRSYSGLKYCIPFDHTAGPDVYLWPVEWVSHLSHHATGRFAGESCIGIKSDDVANIGRHRR